MKTQKIFKFIPVPIFYNCPRLVPPRMQAFSWGIFIAVRSHWMSPGMIEHELEHCRQFYRSLGLSAILYHLSSRKRMMYEVKAYIKNIRQGEMGLGFAASLIKINYDLKYSVNEIKDLIVEEMYKHGKKKEK